MICISQYFCALRSSAFLRTLQPLERWRGIFVTCLRKRKCLSSGLQSNTVTCLTQYQGPMNPEASGLFFYAVTARLTDPVVILCPCTVCDFYLALWYNLMPKKMREMKRFILQYHPKECGVFAPSEKLLTFMTLRTVSFLSKTY